MPPRDAPDARLKTLKFVLDNEPSFPDTFKGWIVNTIHDSDRRKLIEDILVERNQFYVTIPFEKSKFLSAVTRDEQIRYAVNINYARNCAIRYGHNISKYVLVMDGDCFFSTNLWNRFTREIDVDKVYHSIPTSKSTFEHSISSDDPMLLAEPMVAFRYDSDKFFDESLPFGKRDKLSLLYELGHIRRNGRLIAAGQLCKSAGMVHHVSAGDYDVEVNRSLRNELREQSLDRLLQNPSLCFFRF